MAWGIEAPEGLGLLKAPECLWVGWRYPHARLVRSVLIRLPPSVMAAGVLQLVCMAAEQEHDTVQFFLEAVTDGPSDGGDSAAEQSTLLTVQVRGAACIFWEHLPSQGEMPIMTLVPV